MSYKTLEHFSPKALLLGSFMALALSGGFIHASQASASDDAEPSASEELLTENNGRSPAHNNSVSVRAVDAAVDGKWQPAFDLAAQSGDKATLKTVEWLYIRSNPNDSGPERIMNFVAANPDWPASVALTKSAEAMLAKNTTSMDIVARHFNRFTPISAYGHVAFARLALARGDQATAAKSIRAAWIDTKLPDGLEKEIAANYRSLLSSGDMKDRMWALVMAQETNAAIKAAGYISRDHVHAAKVAQALIRSKNNGPALYQKLSGTFKNHPPMVYAYARWYRRNAKHASALNILKQAPTSHAAQVDPDQWFVEKRLVARLLAGPEHKKHWRSIYQLMASHGYTSGSNYIEGEFLAGWYALRKLSNANAAAEHFKRAAEASKTRTDASRAWYWLGRARAASGESNRAEEAYRQAASSPTLFYGQLALDKLGVGTKPLRLTEGSSNADALRRVSQVEVFRAAHQLAQAGGTRHVGLFLFPIARAVKKRDEAAAAINAIQSEAGYFPAVRLAKAFGTIGTDVDNWSYPINALPKWKTIGNRVEKSLIMGLSRQESEFNPVAGSHAGAKGFMQIIPSTGKQIARKYKIGGYSTNSLISNPALNVSMGEAYLGDLIQQFDGSYIMAIASYNAGPGNISKWVNAYGDPRTSQIDAVDWIESIPFTETRKYVQKVMQNVHVYRTRLGEKKFAMSRDINRASTGGTATASTSPAAEGDCAEGKKTIASLITGC